MLSQIFLVDFHVDPLKSELALEYDFILFCFYLTVYGILYIIY
jgi:hypothetical protein